jgi:hypothetical protein
MEFVNLLGYVDDSTFVQFEIKNGNNRDLFGDLVWINKSGTILMISDFATDEVINEVVMLFVPEHRKAFKGALRRMGFELK